MGGAPEGLRTLPVCGRTLLFPPPAVVGLRVARQARSICRDAVFSLRSSSRRPLRSSRSCSWAFSCWRCPTSSWCDCSTVTRCSWSFVVTGSANCSRVARCWRQEAQVAVRSMGSCRDLIWYFVSEIVALVCSILLSVSLISAARRVCTACSEATRSRILRSDAAAASSAAFSARATSFPFSSRSSRAASSRLEASLSICAVSWWRVSSLLLLSCRATWWRACFTPPGRLLGPPEGERVRCSAMDW
mmetsp:Transcript_4004/g.10857  ORF Transcript_4004/g.10857 Transcript_4004/m.10857 type:complete len:246 (-) Transcript_4004:644-1381(-)